MEPGRCGGGRRWRAAVEGGARWCCGFSRPSAAVVTARGAWERHRLACIGAEAWRNVRLLFSHIAKYDSRTGWPGFHTSLVDAVATRTDYQLIFLRTEYHRARCGGHQGSVFEDGPRPSGKRCGNNGVALNFAAEGG